MRQTSRRYPRLREAEKEYRAWLPDSPTAPCLLPAQRPKVLRSWCGRIWRKSISEDNSSEIWWAGAYACEGAREQAIVWLRKSVANQDSEFSYNIRDPIFDFLRSDPRYVELMRGVGLPP